MHHFESRKAAHILATLLFSFKALEKLLIVGLALGSHIPPLSAVPACSQGPAPRAAGYLQARIFRASLSCPSGSKEFYRHI